MIWLSVNFDVFIKNLLRLWYEKILLLTSVNLWGDYPFMATAVFKSEFWRDLNKGKYTEAEVKRALHQQLGLSSDTLEQLFFHIKNTQVLLPGTLQLMDDLLKAGYRLYALTDNVNEIVAYLKNNMTFGPNLLAQ